VDNGELENCDEVLKELVLEMHKKFKKYWTDINYILVFANILDS